MGTLSYVAPEQALDAKRAGPAADLYSLGATLYHLIAGRPPFEPGPNVLEEILEDDPPFLRRRRPDCPPALSSLVEKLLEKEPGARPRSAADLPMSPKLPASKTTVSWWNGGRRVAGAWQSGVSECKSEARPER